MPYKYQLELDSVGNCPREDASEMDLQEVFRFTKSTPPQASCFLPRAHEHSNYKRLNCGLLGISLYTSEAQARSKFEKLKKNNAQAHQLYGEYLAMGSITTLLGTGTPANQDGHFDFYEYDACDIYPQFTVIGRL